MNYEEAALIADTLSAVGFDSDTRHVWTAPEREAAAFRGDAPEDMPVSVTVRSRSTGAEIQTFETTEQANAFIVSLPRNRAERRSRRSERGQSTVEFALLAVFVVGAFFAGLSPLKAAIRTDSAAHTNRLCDSAKWDCGSGLLRFPCAPAESGSACVARGG